MRIRQNQGYSIMEAMIVVTLIGVIASMAVPKFGNYVQQQRLHNDARLLAMELRVARMRAITEKVDYGVLFYPIEQKIEVYRDPLQNPVLVKAAIQLQTANHFRIENISTESGIVFTPRGNIRPECLTNPNSSESTITIWNIRYLPEIKEYLKILATTGLVKWSKDDY
jgi:Tfp pilus assembly protein FimT